jgi:Ca-activated chloride channel family protein
LNLPMLIWLLLVVAIARPQLVDDSSLMKYSGRNLMLAIDLSNSMATADLALEGKVITRLAAAKGLLNEFLLQRFGDRVGLIVFGKQAYVHTPLTFDLQAISDALAGVEIGLAGNETALGDSVALAVKQLGAFPENKRVLVLLTDGANTAGTLAPLRAAWLAQRNQVRIHALGIGASPVNVSKEKASVNTLDETTLEKLTSQTGGSYVRATDAEQIKHFFSQLDKIEPMPAETNLRSLVREYYAWPLAAAFLLMVWLGLRQARGGGR